jgi:very-short-patch-repair endonuclease
MSAEYQTNLLRCEVCGKYYKSITNSHLRDKHNITTIEYKALYPNSDMIADSHKRKLSDWVNSDENKQHIRNLQKNVINNPKRLHNLIKTIKSDGYRVKMSNVMSEYVRNNPEKCSTMLTSPKGVNHIHYKKSNWQRWCDKYGEDIANIKLEEWKIKNRLPGGSRDTKIEKFIKMVLDKCNIHYIPQYSICEFYVDVYIPKYNLIIEADGDYWHANPKKYKADDIIKYPGNRIVTAHEIWDADIKRQSKIESFGYNVIRIFESDVNESYVLNCVNKFDKDIVRTYGKP